MVQLSSPNMQKIVPKEIVDCIAFYLPYEKGIELSPYLKAKLNDIDAKELGVTTSLPYNLWILFACHGNLFRLKWMHFHEIEGCSTDTMNTTARNGHLDLVKWLHVNRSEGCTIFAMSFAAREGHFEIVKWLHCNRSEGCNKDTMDIAAWKGHLEIVKWLHFNRTEGCTEDAMNNAASEWSFRNREMVTFQ
jgi:hypothetical protein